MMEKVHWGSATHPEIGQIPKEKIEGDTKSYSRGGEKEAIIPKVRCGIVLDGIPPSISKHYGYNVLVLYQNFGDIAVSDDILLMGFPIGPVIMTNASHRDRQETIGFPGDFGIYGKKLFRLRGEIAMAVRGAAFHLEPGEATYMWFHIPDFTIIWLYRGENRRALGSPTSKESL